MEETKKIEAVESGLIKPASGLSKDEIRSLPRKLVRIERTTSKSSKQVFYNATVLLYSGKRTTDEINSASPADKEFAKRYGNLSVNIRFKLTEQQFQLICLDKDLNLSVDQHTINSPVRLSHGPKFNGELYSMIETWLPGGVFLKDFLPDETVNFIKIAQKDPRFLKPEHALLFVDRKFTENDEKGNAEIEY